MRLRIGRLPVLEIPTGAMALDVGCGGGRTITKLAPMVAQV
ncbi:MAG: hypothetical protein ABSH56_01270 [Bryobacteraceae bacterium]